MSRAPCPRAAVRRARTVALVLLLLSGFCLLPAMAAAGEIVFLQGGRTLQAEKTEIQGDRVRIEKSTGTVELPRSPVLSIHQVPAPAAPMAPPPSDVYRDLTREMVEKVRRESREPR